MKQTLITATLYTLITAIVLGLGYPFLTLAIARTFFPTEAAGQLLTTNGAHTGSAMLGQPFTGPTYFHSRPSNAGAGYDAANSSGSNLAPTGKALIDRVNQSTASATTPVPVDLVTTSASGLDPDITPAAADYQAPRIAQARHLPLTQVRALIAQHTLPRQFGFLGEPRVPVLPLNRALDALAAAQK
jgi:K+-transporting ATPase ATPase C chain